MPKGIMFVETNPSSPEVAEEYHAWYATHLQDICAVEGFTAARRYAPIGHEGPFVAIYEIDAPDIAAVKASLSDASRAGRTPTSPALQLEPPPQIKLFEEIAAHQK